MEKAIEGGLGPMLRRLRLRNGLTRAQVQAHMSCSRSAVHWWESAEGGRPRTEQLQRLLDLYGATDNERLLAWKLRAQDTRETDAGVAL